MNRNPVGCSTTILITIAVWCCTLELIYHFIVK
jgi:hypothetical protein